jgi:hypothetical protein
MDKTDGRPPSLREGGLYLVVMEEMIVAEDLRGAIFEWDPAAEVAIAGTLADAQLIVLEPDQHLVGAFVMVSPRDYLTSWLYPILDASGKHAILLGDDAEIAGAGPHFQVLYGPFSTADVHAQLSRFASA